MLSGQRIVVIGAAISAVQIAYELAKVAEVTLATREAIRFFPQKLLGADFHAWLKCTGLERTRWLNDQSTPVLNDATYKKALKSGLFNQRSMFGQVTPTGVFWADGHHEAVDCLVFANWVPPKISFLEDLAVTDDQGRLMQRDGRALHIPGLYFMGSHCIGFRLMFE